VDDEVLARLAPLIGVVNARVDERLLDAVAIDGDGRLVRVLLDDREQVAQQPPLGRRQLDPLDRLVRIGILKPVDGSARRRYQRRRRAGGVLGGGFRSGAVVRGRVLLLGAGAAQPLGRGFALLRYRCPSSYRCA
jgi:hypothetical protein